MFDVTVVIVNYNAKKFIVECINSIIVYNRILPSNIIVVDNASTDGSIELIKTTFPEVKIIVNQTNVGFAKANNQATKYIKTKYILFLNPDTEFIDNSIEKMVTFLEQNLTVAIVGPKLLNSDGSLQLTGNTFPTLRNILIETFFLDRLFPKSKLFGQHKMSYKNPNSIYPVDWVMGACMMVRKDVYSNMDENMFMYFEDTDLCFRAKKSGWGIYYLGEASIIHHGGTGLDAYNEFKIIKYHKSLFYFFKKHYSTNYVSLLKAIVLLRTLIRLILVVCTYPFLKKVFLEKMRGYLRVLKLFFVR